MNERRNLLGGFFPGLIRVGRDTEVSPQHADPQWDVQVVKRPDGTVKFIDVGEGTANVDVLLSPEAAQFVL